MLFRAKLSKNIFTTLCDYDMVTFVNRRIYKMKKNDKKTEPKNDVITEMKEEFKRHTTALMEHMTKEVKIVAEGHGVLAKRLDNIESDLTGVKSDLDIVKTVVMDTNQRVKVIEKKFDNHETRITKLEEKVLI